MHRNSYLFVASILILLAISESSRAASKGLQDISPTSNDLVSSLTAAYEEWLTNVEFKGSYKQRRGRSKSLEAGLAGECELWFTRKDGKQYETRGVIVKKGAGLRYSKAFPVEATKIKDEGDTSIWRNVAFDEVVFGKLQARHNSGFPSGASTVTVEGRADGSGDSQVLKVLASGKRAQSEISPLAIMAGDAKSPLFLRLPVGAHAEDITVQSRKPLPTELEIILNYSQGKRTKKKTITFLMSASPPVVTEIRQDSTIVGVGTTQAASRASNFVECPGGLVAQTVVYTALSRSKEHPDLPWLTYEWTSPDLGEILPTNSDFSIPLSEKQRVIGIRPDLAKTEIALPKLSTDDLTHHTRRDDLAVPATASSQSYFLALNIVIIVLITLAIVHRNYQKKSHA